MRACVRSFLPLVVCLASRVAAQPCPGISPETAQRLFDRTKQVAVGAGYHFEGVSTDKSELRVLWSLNGEACPPIDVAVENCRSLFGLAGLRLRVPPELSVRCPGLQAVVQELSSAVAAEHPVGHGAALPPAAVPGLLGIGLLVLVAGLVIRRLLAPLSRERWRFADLTWLVFVLALAAPFFFNVPFAVAAELAAGWVVLAVLLCDRALLGIERRTEWLAALGLFVFALLLHWLMSSGGPGDLHLNLVAIRSSEVEQRWGPSPVALFRLLAFFVGGLSDTGVLWCNLVLSSVLPILLYAIIAAFGVDKRAAVLATAVTAAHPLLIAFSGVLGRQPAYLFAALGSTLALIGFLQHGGGRRFAAFVLGTVLAATCRPEGGHVLIVQLAVLFLVPASRRARGAAAVALALLFPLGFAYVHYFLGTGVGGRPFAGRLPFLSTVLLSPDFTPTAWIVAWVCGVVLGIRRRAAWAALLMLLGLDIAWRWTGLYGMFVGHERQVASARYESILLVPFGLGVALLFQAVLPPPRGAARGVAPASTSAALAGLRWKRWAFVSVLAAFIGGTAATFPRPYETLLRPFTVDYEYRFLKRYALTLAAGARLYIFDSVIDDIGFLDAHLVGQFVGSPVSFRGWSERQCDDLHHDGAPTYLYIGSSCAPLLDDANHSLRDRDYVTWMRDCAAMRARVGGELVEEVEVPARKMSWHDFKEATVHLALYRVTDPTICEVGPRLYAHPERGDGSSSE